jgi:hypothetical protein
MQKLIQQPKWAPVCDRRLFKSKTGAPWRAGSTDEDAKFALPVEPAGMAKEVRPLVILTPRNACAGSLPPVKYLEFGCSFAPLDNLWLD